MSYAQQQQQKQTNKQKAITRYFTYEFIYQIAY